MIGCVETNPGMEAANSSSARGEDGTSSNVTLRQFNILELLEKQRSEETTAEAFSAINLQESQQVMSSVRQSGTAEGRPVKVFWVFGFLMHIEDTQKTCPQLSNLVQPREGQSRSFGCLNFLCILKTPKRHIIINHKDQQRGLAEGSSSSVFRVFEFLMHIEDTQKTYHQLSNLVQLREGQSRSLGV
jgi:hypothetical protein